MTQLSVLFSIRNAKLKNQHWIYEFYFGFCLCRSTNPTYTDAHTVVTRALRALQPLGQMLHIYYSFFSFDFCFLFRLCTRRIHNVPSMPLHAKVDFIQCACHSRISAPARVCMGCRRWSIITNYHFGDNIWSYADTKKKEKNNAHNTFLTDTQLACRLCVCVSGFHISKSKSI